MTSFYLFQTIVTDLACIMRQSKRPAGLGGASHMVELG